jgi:hypothetical protein
MVALPDPAKRSCTSREFTARSSVQADPGSARRSYGTISATPPSTRTSAPSARVHVLLPRVLMVTTKSVPALIALGVIMGESGPRAEGSITARVLSHEPGKASQPPKTSSAAGTRKTLWTRSGTSDIGTAGPSFLPTADIGRRCATRCADWRRPLGRSRCGAPPLK